MTLPDIIALDMDGTLLDDDGNIPNDFWDVLAELEKRGVHVAPASGRQLATLRNMFEDVPVPPDTYIAENGAVVWYDGDIIATSPIKPESVHKILDVLETADFGHNVVLATPLVAYVDENISADRLDNVTYYYHATEKVASLRDIADNEDVIKVAIHVHTDAERDAEPILSDALPGYEPVVSAKHWVDVMEPGTHKGVAIEQIADKVGVSTDTSAAFGDYLNDYELLQSAGHAVAMQNAHEKLKEIADEIAPSNTEQGVVTVLRRWLDES